ncbi:MAG: hypothetical protein K2I49_03490, partial [Ureaplasma sp.]|nr:hypothetical protein [Ureaplasma sp.]
MNLQNSPSTSRINIVADTDTTLVDRPTILPSIPTDTTVGADEIDPNFNVNPIETIKKLLEDTVSKFVQSDLNDVVLEFLSCVEYDSKKSEIELRDKEDVGDVILVKKVTLDSNFLITRKIIVTADVQVEQEINGKEQNRIIQDFEFDLYVEFAGKNDVLSLLTRLLKQKPQAGSNNNVDYDDLLELFLGENDKDLNDDDFDLDDFNRDSSIDDIGLVKFMSNVNDKINANAKMFGYTFDISDFWTKLATKANAKINDARITNSTNSNVFWAPSTSLCKIFLPNITNKGVKLELVISEITNQYTDFATFKTDIDSLVKDADKSKLLNKLKSFGLEFPEGTEITSAKLETEVDYTNNIKSIELE